MTTPLAVRGTFRPEVILGRPDTLSRLIDTYFAQRTPKDEIDQPAHYRAPQPVTPASLALHLGFSSVPQMLEATTLESAPSESRHLLMSGLTQIEALLSEGALTERVNVGFAKFMLSARLGVVEKKEIVGEDNSIRISILGVDSNIQVNSNLEELL
jgi:hypothetical protein